MGATRRFSASDLVVEVVAMLGERGIEADADNDRLAATLAAALLLTALGIEPALWHDRLDPAAVEFMRIVGDCYGDGTLPGHGGEQE